MGLYAGEIGALDRHCAQPLQGLRSFRAQGSAGVDFTQRDLLGMSRHCEYGSEGAGREREYDCGRYSKPFRLAEAVCERARSLGPGNLRARAAFLFVYSVFTMTAHPEQVTL